MSFLLLMIILDLSRPSGVVTMTSHFPNERECQAAIHVIKREAPNVSMVCFPEATTLEPGERLVE